MGLETANPQTIEVRSTPAAELATAIVERAILDLDVVDQGIIDEAWSFLTAPSGGWKEARDNIAGLITDPDILREMILRRWPEKPGQRRLRSVVSHAYPSRLHVLNALQSNGPEPMTRTQIAEAAGISRDRVSCGLNELAAQGLAKSLGRNIGWILLPQDKTVSS